MAGRICGGLKYSNDLTAQVVDLVRHHMAFMQVRQMRPAKMKRLLGRPDFHLQLELHRADALGSDGVLDAYDYCVEQRRELAVEHGEAMRPAPLATGEDLIAMGLKPGPRFGPLLEALHDAQLEGRIGSRDEAIAFLKARAEEGAAGDENAEAGEPDDGG